MLIFDRVFVPWERVFLAGEWEHSAALTYSYATHHRHTCIGARAGFGDLLIGAGALMCEANGFDPGSETHLREQMVELIKIIEGFYACGVAASVYATAAPHSGTLHAGPGVREHRQAAAGDPDLRHAPDRALRVGRPDRHACPGRTRTTTRRPRRRWPKLLRANPDVPYDKRIEAARFLEDLTASYQGGWYSVISLHGGGSPAAMKQEIWRNYPVGNKVELVERLLESRRPGRRPAAPDHREPAARSVLRHRLHAARQADDG